ncbi:efflux RND transporter periplasmic adaptor subunit [Thalassotalea mangrovi]|uniref:Efflux RND transporter periplasmic adaptor subunit n=1 Tax=Thalassotalea mangrovi TaxID=2572245 RepID=A0A4U1B9V1_9GAMM|nr:efflux RND transporter periplasmic adaptor subunit [Thalassotalea mangrovi]TKB47501.1 efflux RND transporter periplasmic adaptor subunit [Thalassotalea mangrovi]
MENKSVSRLPLILLAVVLTALIVYLQWPENVAEEQRRARQVSVKTTPVIKAEFSDEFEALGTAKANEQVMITAQYSDIVESIHFEDGDRVNKGDVLVQLENTEELAKVNELQSNLEEAEAQLKRYNNLLERNVGSVSQRDQQLAKVQSIRAQLKSAHAVLNNLTIRAPFSGQLGFRQVSVGALVTNGDRITSLDDLDSIKVDFAIPERFLPTVSVGQSIKASNVAYPEEYFSGTVTGISSRVDSLTRTIQIRAQLPNLERKLRPGMLMGITIKRKVVEIMQLPESAVIPFEDSHFVFVAENGVAKRKPVVIGRRKPGIVEIVSGLELSEEVVIEGALKLRDGAQLKIVNDNQAMVQGGN